MIIKSANLMALQYLLTAPEEMMEKEATVRTLAQAPRRARGAARRARRQVQRQPQVQAHNNARAPRGNNMQAAPAAQGPATARQMTPEEAYFNQYGHMPDQAMISQSTVPHTGRATISRGTAPSAPAPQGPSFRRGMAQVGQGFGEMGSAIAQGGRNAINRGLQVGANAANSVRNGLQATGNAIAGGVKATGNAISNGLQTTGNAIASGARTVKNGLQTTGNAIVGGVKSTGNAIMNGGRNALEWAQKNPGLALGGGYVLYDQLTDN